MRRRRCASTSPRSATRTAQIAAEPWSSSGCSTTAGSTEMLERGRRSPRSRPRSDAARAAAACTRASSRRPAGSVAATSRRPLRSARSRWPIELGLSIDGSMGPVLSGRVSPGCAGDFDAAERECRALDRGGGGQRRRHHVDHCPPAARRDADRDGSARRSGRRRSRMRSTWSVRTGDRWSRTELLAQRDGPGSPRRGRLEAREPPGRGRATLRTGDIAAECVLLDRSRRDRRGGGRRRRGRARMAHRSMELGRTTEYWWWTTDALELAEFLARAAALAEAAPLIAEVDETMRRLGYGLRRRPDRGGAGGRSGLAASGRPGVRPGPAPGSDRGAARTRRAGPLGSDCGRVISTIRRRIGRAPVISMRRRRPRSTSSLTAVFGRSATPRPCWTIFLAASMLSSSIAPRGLTPASRNIALVRS